MATKKFTEVILILIIPLLPCLMVPSVYGNAGDLQSQVIAHAGKSYPGVEDPTYISYDQALRAYMVERIKEKFGVALDPKTYSGFDLLEIESLLRVKKSDEPIDDFLKMFPKHP